MSQIAQQIINPTVVDPNNVAETYCNGPVNLNLMGPCGTITLTSVRANAAQAFSGNQVTEHLAIVTARITMPAELLVELKNLLNRMLPEQPMAIGPYQTQ
jgi:hypothetical protein